MKRNASRRYRKIARLRQQGVRLLDPDTVYLEGSVIVGEGTVIYPNVILRGDVSIGSGCKIGPNTLLENVRVGDGTTVNASQVYDSSIGSDSEVGPFAYIRPGSSVGSHVKVGDFVELKNAVIEDYTKISHLTYVGDADVGRRVNIGCGVVTVNYDGQKKRRTVIRDGAFIGCNTNLVAPVTVEEGAYTAAGSTITETVPAGALGIARARQCNKEGWTKKSGLLKGRS